MLDAVVVGAPYRGEDCKGVSGAQAEMVRRVRKVVSALLCFSFFLSQRTPRSGLIYLFHSITARKRAQASRRPREKSGRARRAHDAGHGRRRATKRGLRINNTAFATFGRCRERWMGKGQG